MALEMKWDPLQGVCVYVCVCVCVCVCVFQACFVGFFFKTVILKIFALY